MSDHVIYGINGPVVTLRNARAFSMQEMVFVGRERLIGEVIGVTESATIIQVYESTTGLKPGEPVVPTGHPLSVTLGPGLLRNIFDGIERPLTAVEAADGPFIGRGSALPALDEAKTWPVTLTAKVGDRLTGGAVYATCPETEAILHKVMLRPDLSGEIIWTAPDGDYRVRDVVARLRDDKGVEHELTLCQEWPIRVPRPVAARRPCDTPLITGQRVIDTLFPIAKGGTAAIPGGFGTGKTMTQHQLAKWCDADLILYVGCGERGNEMTQVLEEFGALVDPRTGKNLTERTVLIANTSNMPVAAREASIYTGITIAEYYRDMGYDVAMMADSTSRWAEALREISGRLEEMPAEEGFPAYLPSRLSEFYERAGAVDALSGRPGSVTVIGAVSPQGSDFSEPVTQNTKRFTRVFWALDKALAYARHYPAIHWTQSYSEYVADLTPYYDEKVGREFMEYRAQVVALLRQESELMEIVKLIGADVLPDNQKLTIEIARILRVGFLQQNAYHPEDTYVPLEKQKKMMETVLYLHQRAGELVTLGIPLSGVKASGLFEQLTKMKYDVANDELAKFDDYRRRIDGVIDDCLRARGGEQE